GNVQPLYGSRPCRRSSAPRDQPCLVVGRTGCANDKTKAHQSPVHSSRRRRENVVPAILLSAETAAVSLPSFFREFHTVRSRSRFEALPPGGYTLVLGTSRWNRCCPSRPPTSYSVCCHGWRQRRLAVGE